jgi:AcrR family transcriptional regulator
MEGVTGFGQQPRLACRRPEAIGGARESEAGVSSYEAWVETTQEHPHGGADGVGKGAQPSCPPGTESLEARTRDDVVDASGVGRGREVPIDVLARDRRPVHASERHRKAHDGDGAEAVHARSLAYVPVDLTVRERILEAGYACVARYGLAKTTVEDVARAARLSRATLYRHFPGGRDQLMREVIAWETGRFFGRLAEAVAGAPDFAHLLEEALVFAHRAVEEHAVLQKMLQTEPERLLPQLTVESERVLMFIRGFLVPYLEREQLAAGIDAEQAADYVARMLYSFTANQGRWDLTDPAQVSRLVRTELLAGVLNDSQASSDG